MAKLIGGEKKGRQQLLTPGMREVTSLNNLHIRGEIWKYHK